GSSGPRSSWCAARPACPSNTALAAPPSATRRRQVLSPAPGSREKRAARAFRAARMADHYHSGSEHGIIGRQIETIVTSWFHRPKACAVPTRRGGSGRKGMGDGGDEAAEG